MLCQSSADTATFVRRSDGVWNQMRVADTSLAPTRSWRVTGQCHPQSMPHLRLTSLTQGTLPESQPAQLPHATQQTQAARRSAARRLCSVGPDPCSVRLDPCSVGPDPCSVGPDRCSVGPDSWDPTPAVWTGPLQCGSLLLQCGT